MDLSNPANLLIAGVYYLITGVLVLFSAFAVYILMRYGKSVLLSLAVSLFYGFFFLTILASSYHTLNNL